MSDSTFEVATGTYFQKTTKGPFYEAISDSSDGGGSAGRFVFARQIIWNPAEGHLKRVGEKTPIPLSAIGLTFAADEIKGWARDPESSNFNLLRPDLEVA